ncbi:MAG: adenosylcobinamide-GDP ribazoletransferase [Paracoccaceae bacterium]|nr:adenosylcobinamide-GDP ribazoletransferase [Paracoccaceae bacterium]
MSSAPRLWLAARRDEARLALMLLTRLPMGQIANPPTLAAAVWAYPLAGVAVGAVIGGVYSGAVWLGLLASVASVLAVTAGVVATGGMHEDGLADLADGFGGGQTRARKLEIMRDSRVGSYGVIALVLALALRLTLLAAMVGGWRTIFALIGLAAMSRAVLPVLMLTLPQARAEGLGANAAAQVSRGAVFAAAGIGCALALVGIPGAIAVIVVIAVAGAAMAMLAMRQIGGMTGDVFGATQVVCELAGWIVLTAHLAH